MKLIELLLIRLTRPHWFALYLVPSGFLAAHTYFWLFGNDSSSLGFAGFTLVALLGLRVLGALARRTVPVSGTVKTGWAGARLVGKRYDSFQWQKLLWVGVGAAMVALQTPGACPTLLVPSLAYLALGFAGTGIWAWRRRTDKAYLAPYLS